MNSDSLQTGNIFVDLLSGESVWLVILALVLSGVLTWLLKDRETQKKDHNSEIERLQNIIAEKDKIIAEKDKRIDDLHELARTELRESIKSFNVINNAIDKLLTQSDKSVLVAEVRELQNKIEHIRIDILQTTQKNG